MATSRERLEAHERECLIRYEHITDRLDKGVAKFDKLERMMFGMYPFILSCIVVAKWL